MKSDITIPRAKELYKMTIEELIVQREFLECLQSHYGGPVICSLKDFQNFQDKCRKIFEGTDETHAYGNESTHL